MKPAAGLLPLADLPRRAEGTEGGTSAAAPAFLDRRETFLVLALALFAAGVGLRLLNLLGGRHLWLDELFLLPNVLDRPFSGLAEPLANNQLAPVGFLAVSKLFSLLPLEPEVSLRLWSVLVSVPALAAVPLLVLRAGGGRAAALLALAVVATFFPFVWHDAEFKPYAGEFAFSVLASVACLAVLADGSPRRRGAFFATGLAASALTISAPFVLAPLGLLLAAQDLGARRWRALAATLAGCAVWAAVWLASVLPVLDQGNDAYLRSFWDEAFLPLPLRPYSVTWLFDQVFRFFEEAAGFGFAGGLAVLLFLLGLHRMASERRWQALVVLAGPLAVALLAACLQLYPFVGRLVHFATPGAVALVAIGAVALAARFRAGEAGAFLLAAVLLAPGAKATLTAAFPERPPFERDGTEPALAAIARDRAPGDIVYAAGVAVPGLARFLDREGIADPGFVAGGPRADTDRLFRDADRFAAEGARVWFVFANSAHPASLANQWILDAWLARRGTVVEQRTERLARVLLVDFGRPPAPAGSGAGAPAGVPAP